MNRSLGLKPANCMKYHLAMPTSTITAEVSERLRGRTIDSPNPLKRLLQGNVTERFGRFRTVRRAYSVLRRYQQGDKSQYRDRLRPFTESLFPALHVNRCVKNLTHEAYSSGFQLSPAMTAEIYNFARKSYCTEPGTQKAFQIDDVQDGRLTQDGGREVYRALVANPLHCTAIQKLVHDPLLLEIVHRYLHYWPDRITTHLTWSIASNRPVEVVRKHYPPTNFHYDIAGHNFMTVYFYITPVQTVEDGAHIMILRSHGSKPFMLLGSGRHSDATIHAHYGLQNAIPILGGAGFGFVQDPSCIHRVEAPRSSHRLLFQIRYS
jgi:hypothetical protein